MNNSLNRLTQAAFKAKVSIDGIQDIESLERAYLAMGRLAIVAVKTPFAIQTQAEELQPGIPVMDGLFREIHAATVRLALDSEKARLAAVS
jgi:hypothetical protein